MSDFVIEMNGGDYEAADTAGIPLTTLQVLRRYSSFKPLFERGHNDALLEGGPGDEASALRRRRPPMVGQEKGEEEACLLTMESEPTIPRAYDASRRVTPPVPSLAVRTERAELARALWREECNKAMDAIASSLGCTLDTQYGRVNVDGPDSLRAELLALRICESVIVFLPGGGAHHLMCADERRVIWVHARTEQCLICRTGARAQL